MQDTDTPVSWICETCGTQFAPTAAAPHHCPICEDERQYVGWGGQRWTTMAALRARHAIDLRTEDGILTMSMAPPFAIGQRAFLIPHGGKRLMWECLSLVTPEAVGTLEALGGVSAIAVSHPHFYSAMAAWSEALGGVPVYTHEADRSWVQCASSNQRFWRGERLALSADLELVHLPGHFPGSAGLWWRRGPHGKGALLPGDALQVTMDRRHVTFMYSYPNHIPLGPSTVRHLRRVVAALTYDDVFGFSRGRQIIGAAQAAVEASFERYLAAVGAAG